MGAAMRKETTVMVIPFGEVAGSQKHEAHDEPDRHRCGCHHQEFVAHGEPSFLADICIFLAEGSPKQPGSAVRR
jgi:hypothetical protein